MWHALPLAIALAVTPAVVDAQEARWTGTTSFSTGSYVFDAPTRTLSLSTGLWLSWGDLDVGGSIPFLLQNSQLVSQVGGVTLPTGGSDYGAVAGRQSGQTVGSHGQGQGGSGGTGSTAEVVYRDAFAWEIGDPFLSASMRAYTGTGFVRPVQLQGSTKAPLRGLDSGVGTGEWDFGAGASALTSLAPGTYAFADVSYWWYGDLPGLELSDGLSYGVGLSHAVFDARGSVLLSFLGSDAIIDTMDRPASLALGAMYSLRTGASLSGGMAVGLSESSPDVSVYAGWSLVLS